MALIDVCMPRRDVPSYQRVSGMVPPRGVSPNLALDQQLSHRIAAGERVMHLGLGESRLPVHPALIDRLAAAAPAHSYGPVAGGEADLRGAGGEFTRPRVAPPPAAGCPPHLTRSRSRPEARRRCSR